jgi:aminodeoxyfutalosine synthase
MATHIERLAESELADLLPEVEAGSRMKRSDCLRLWQTDDLTSLGVLANMARERVSGSTAYFHTAFHANTTGAPTPACPECSALAAAGLSSLFAIKPSAAGEDTRMVQTGELHLTGGWNPGTDLDMLCRLIERLVAAYPRRRIRAFTWQELEHAAAKDGMTPAAALALLAGAGLSSIAGGSLVDLLPGHPHLGPKSIAAMERRMPWIQAAADLGLKAELSWVSGDADDPEILTDTLVCIRGIQDYRPIFESFAPLPFRWESDGLDLPIPTGYNHLRAVAVGRLFLDNITRIRSSAFAVSESLAQVAQWYGADDAGSSGVPGEEGSAIGYGQMLKLLRDAGREPLEI